jgi:chemotaxis signal transduction protein
MPVSNAWLLSFSDQLYAAVGNMEMVHILPNVPELTEISHAPVFCKYTIPWESQDLPVMDLASFLYREQEKKKNGTCYNDKLIGVVAYYDLEKKQQCHGALLIHKVPVRIEVDDKQACDLPESPVGWAKLANSCFEYTDNKYVPILDIPRIFSNNLV